VQAGGAKRAVLAAPPAIFTESDEPDKRSVVVQQLFS
jgi:hypothetical protein